MDDRNFYYHNFCQLHVFIQHKMCAGSTVKLVNLQIYINLNQIQELPRFIPPSFLYYQAMFYYLNNVT